MSEKVLLSDLIDELNLKLLTNVDYTGREITKQEINRPGIQLTGFFEHYDASRIQIIGFVEAEYIKKLNEAEKKDIYSKLLSKDVPGIIFCRDLQPDELFIQIASENNVPVLVTKKITTLFMSDIIKWLNVKLAPSITIHGCLVDVYGVGVLIKGESGIGKSEAVLELIKRGHRLVADDAVEIHKVGENSIYGKAPKITKDFIEIRGIGIVDIKTLYGLHVIKDTQNIDMVATLEEWNREKVYDRIGLENKYTNILDIEVVNYEIPVRPGRNLAVILEAAAVCYRQRQLGYNSASVFLERSMRGKKGSN